MDDKSCQNVQNIQRKNSDKLSPVKAITLYCCLCCKNHELSICGFTSAWAPCSLCFDVLRHISHCVWGFLTIFVNTSWLAAILQFTSTVYMEAEQKDSLKSCLKLKFEISQNPAHMTQHTLCAARESKSHYKEFWASLQGVTSCETNYLKSPFPFVTLHQFLFWI